MMGWGGSNKMRREGRVGSCCEVKGCHGDMVRLAQKKKVRERKRVRFGMQMIG